MNTEALVKLREYWESLRNGRPAPYRAELDPRKFEDVLENMFILEQLNPNQVRVRLAGMALCELMGMEVRGMPPEAFIGADDREEFGRQVQTVLTGPAIVELDLMAADISDTGIRGQMLIRTRLQTQIRSRRARAWHPGLSVACYYCDSWSGSLTALLYR